MQRSYLTPTAAAGKAGRFIGRFRWRDSAPAPDAEFKEFLQNNGDRCNGCGRRFRDIEITTTGTGIAGRLVLVGDCCAGKLVTITGIGVFIGYADPWSADDEKWFKARPWRRHRCRAPIEDELTASPNISKGVALLTPEALAQRAPLICIRKRPDGRRERTVLLLDPNMSIPDNESAAKRMCELAFEGGQE